MRSVRRVKQNMTRAASIAWATAHLRGRDRAVRRPDADSERRGPRRALDRADELQPDREAERATRMPGVQPRELSARRRFEHLACPGPVGRRRVRPRDPLLELELERREPHAL